ncbi:MAG: hypothetical protein AAGJ95_09285 [Cyanobacteria bacterium J06554_11]
MRFSHRLIPFLFLPAGLGILLRLIQATSLAEGLLAIALILFCPELARMALVDVSNLTAIAQQQQDTRLDRFRNVVNSTIVLELAGFYIAFFSLPAGAIIVIFSQLWFNLLAGIELHPKSVPSVTSLGIPERTPLLIANGLGLFLLGLWVLWPNSNIRTGSAAGLSLLITLFLGLKYLLPSIGAKDPDD